MHIKQATVIPPGTKITVVKSSNSKARSVYSLEREQERKLMAAAEKQVWASQYKQLRANGLSVAEAISLLVK